MEIFFRAFNEQRIYRREGYDILTYFADLGGMVDLLYITLKIFVAIFAEKLLRKRIVSSMYRV